MMRVLPSGVQIRRDRGYWDFARAGHCGAHHIDPRGVGGYP
jgi:hypothetical protein